MKQDQMQETWLRNLALDPAENPAPRLLADIALSQRAIAAAEQERVAILKTAMAQLDELETRVLTLEANDAARRTA